MQITNKNNTSFTGIHILNTKCLSRDNKITRLKVFELTPDDKPFLRYMYNNLEIERLAPQIDSIKMEVWYTMLKEAIDLSGGQKYKSYLLARGKKPCGVMTFEPNSHKYEITRVCTWPVKKNEKVPLAGKTLFKTAFEEFLKSKSNRSATARNCDIKQLNAKRKRMEELDVLIRTAFEEKVLKKMPENLCNSLCESYQKEQQTLQTEIAALEKKLQDESKNEADVEEYIRRIKLYGNFPELTREMCLQLIEFITIDAKTEHNNRWHPPAPRNIHIYYKLIDKEHAKPREN